MKVRKRKRRRKDEEEVSRCFLAVVHSGFRSPRWVLVLLIPTGKCQDRVKTVAILCHQMVCSRCNAARAASVREHTPSSVCDR